MDLPSSVPNQQLLGQLWNSMERATSGSLPPSQLLSEFANGIADVVSTDDGPVNKYDLLCPHKPCSTIILKKGVATMVEKASLELEPSGRRDERLPALPEPPETTQWWLITPSPMTFENIGFSRTVASQSAAEPHLKLLVCSECDLGPLGWTIPGGTEFWLACSRVGYQYQSQSEVLT